MKEKRVVFEFRDQKDLEGYEIIDGAIDLLPDGDVTQADVDFARRMWGKPQAPSGPVKKVKSKDE